METIKNNNMIQYLTIFSLFLFLCISCRNLFSDFIIDTELCYDENKSLFIHTYKNGSSKTYYFSHFHNKRLDKVDSSLHNEFYKFNIDTLIIILNLKESQSRYFQGNFNQKDSVYIANTRNVLPIYPLGMFSNYFEVFRINELIGLSFKELEKNVKYIKITYSIKSEKQNDFDSLINIFKLVKCCD